MNMSRGNTSGLEVHTPANSVPNSPSASPRAKRLKYTSLGSPYVLPCGAYMYMTSLTGRGFKASKAQLSLRIAHLKRARLERARLERARLRRVRLSSSRLANT